MMKLSIYKLSLILINTLRNLNEIRKVWWFLRIWLKSSDNCEKMSICRKCCMIWNIKISFKCLKSVACFSCFSCCSLEISFITQSKYYLPFSWKHRAKNHEKWQRAQFSTFCFCYTSGISGDFQYFVMPVWIVNVNFVWMFESCKQIWKLLWKVFTEL